MAENRECSSASSCSKESCEGCSSSGQKTSFAADMNQYSLSLIHILKKSECRSYQWNVKDDTVDYALLYENRYDLLRKAKVRFFENVPQEYWQFCEKEADWLDDFALFMALKEAHNGAQWSEWERPLKFREAEAIAKAKDTYADEIDFWKMLQYLFFEQWCELKNYANERGIRIIGDVPIYVAGDSVDVWTNPSQFYLDENLEPIDLAGCPPDACSADGQLSLIHIQMCIRDSPYTVETYGIIYNNAIMEKYFALDGAVVKSMDEINSYDKLKEVVEDMTAKKKDLGIDGVFASTSLKPGEDWRWQTHLANLPIYYEYKDNKVSDMDKICLLYTSRCV